MESIKMGIVGALLFIATALGGPSTAIQGVVKDSKGHVIKGADVRIESRDGSRLFRIVKTDANGRYVSDGLTAGVYRVTLVVNGAVKASIMNTTTRADRPTQLNFDLRPAATSQARTAGKHMIWVPSTTGSHIGGRWVEADEVANPDASSLNVKKADAEAFHREQMQNSQGPQSLLGTGPPAGPP
ncbi:MAG TPA: carboxypeptidase-like regulatory domain-containing protein [Candidatus Udaeobacter sp.]|nr:carboxypeptidase-like regulatory domain-containing protein [Candidatus Udaeobacter sp.]